MTCRLSGRKLNPRLTATSRVWGQS